MGIRLASWFLEFSLVFIARYEKLKSLETNTAKKHKNGFTVIPDRIEFPHQRRLFIKRNKMHKACLFFSLLQRGTSSVWKCYVTLEIVNHCIRLQTNKEPVTPPVCLSTRSGGGRGGVFLIWWRLGDIRWAHGPWRWICSSWMPARLTNTSSSTDTSKHLLLQFPWTHPPSPLFTTTPGRPALRAPSSPRCHPPSL